MKGVVNMVGRLALIKNDNTVFVVWDYNEKDDIVELVELDRPQDGKHLYLKSNEIHLLEPIEIIERVTEWK